jgi:hypothetical protein
VEPPCVTSEKDLADGLDVIDDALDLADRYYTGS